MRFLHVIIPGVVTLIATIAHSDTVFQRDGMRELTGVVRKIDDSGVSLQKQDGVTVLLPLDRVRDVVTDLHDSDWDLFKPVAEDLWRARTRLERRDMAMAESLFVEQFKRYRGHSHETALVVAEGLLRCLIARGAHDEAVIPALEVARLRRAGVATKNYSNLPRVYDEELSLCPYLPPVWVYSTELDDLEHELAEYVVPDDKVTAAMALLYRIAVRKHLGQNVNSFKRDDFPDHPGLSLLLTVVESTLEDSQTRRAAREALSRDVSELKPWSQAWAHYFIGASLLIESGTGRKQTGVVSMLHVPARYGDEQPYLAGLALQRASEVIESLGESRAAESLMNELREKYSRHPIHTKVTLRKHVRSHDSRNTE